VRKGVECGIARLGTDPKRGSQSNGWPRVHPVLVHLRRPAHKGPAKSAPIAPMEKRSTQLERLARPILPLIPPDPDPDLIPSVKNGPTTNSVQQAGTSAASSAGTALMPSRQPTMRTVSRLPMSRSMIAQRKAAENASISSAPADPAVTEPSVSIQNSRSVPSRIFMPRDTMLRPQVTRAVHSRQPALARPVSTGPAARSGIPRSGPKQLSLHPTSPTGIISRMPISKKPTSRFVPQRQKSIPLKVAESTPYAMSAIEDAKPSFDQLRATMDVEDANLFGPLLVALFALAKVYRSIEVPTPCST